MRNRNGVRSAVDSKKLEILMRAAELGSLTKASEVCGYTQSGLTHMMDALEKEIGFPILQRNHNGIRLNDRGVALLPAIREVLQASANLESQIRAVSEKKEVIRVAAYASLAAHWMPEILFRFRRVCPDTVVDLRMVDHALEPFDLLKNGETDMIFASRHDYSFCSWVPLYEERMYAVLPLSYPLNGREEFPISEYEGLEFLMPYGKFDRDVEAACRGTCVHLNSRVCRVDDETVIHMVGRGLGISMMTELMIRGRTQEVQCVPVTPPAIRELGMGTHIRKKETESIRKLKECAIRFVEELTSSAKQSI